MVPEVDRVYVNERRSDPKDEYDSPIVQLVLSPHPDDSCDAMCFGYEYSGNTPPDEEYSVFQQLADAWNHRVDWTADELAAIATLGKLQDLSLRQILRQALRLYQVHVIRTHAGETCVWLGDSKRASEFLPLRNCNYEEMFGCSPKTSETKD